MLYSTYPFKLAHSEIVWKQAWPEYLLPILPTAIVCFYMPHQWLSSVGACQAASQVTLGATLELPFLDNTQRLACSRPYPLSLAYVRQQNPSAHGLVYPDLVPNGRLIH